MENNSLDDLISFINTDPIGVNVDDLSNLENDNFYRSGYEKKSLDILKQNRYDLNTKLRKILSFWAAFIVSSWLTVVSYILLNNNDLYCLSDNVLITLLTTTTVNILGIIAIVMYDIFNGKSENNIN